MRAPQNFFCGFWGALRAKCWKSAIYNAKKSCTNRLHLRKRAVLWLSLAATTNQQQKMITFLFTATFAQGYTVEQKTGKVFRLIQSLPNGSAYAEFIGTLEDISDDVYGVLASDDRARCTV